jgi:NHL repeat
MTRILRFRRPQRIQKFFSPAVRRGAPLLCLAAVVLLGAIAASVAFADEASSRADATEPPLTSKAALAEASAEATPVAMPQPLTPPADSSELEHLDRAEAEDVLEGVFGSAVEGAAQALDELEVEEFRSDRVAVVSPPNASGQAPLGLVSSLLPLRAENPEGEKELVDLDLERVEGQLMPENPLVPVQIPDNLSEGIAFPGTGISIDVPSVEGQRTSSLAGDASAFFPNVATNSDLIVAPTTLGVEAFTQLRAPDSPRASVYHLDLPPDIELRGTEAGGAEAVSSTGHVALTVPPPSAVDGEGNGVPAVLEVQGADSIRVSVEPNADTVYPVLVDPVFERYDLSVEPEVGCARCDWSQAHNPGFATEEQPDLQHRAMTARAYQGATSSGSQATWQYYVPRYWHDLQHGQPAPTSFIRDMKLWNLTYMMPMETAPATAYPFMQLGIAAENSSSWVAFGYRDGTEGQATDMNWVYDLANPSEIADAKHGGFSIATFSSWNNATRYVSVQQASVEVTDKDSPTFEELGNVSSWVGSTARPVINYKLMDPGLGVHEIRLSYPAAGGGTGEAITPVGIVENIYHINCTGAALSACPQTISQTTDPISYNPSQIAQGETWMRVYGVDPVGHWSVVNETHIKVDRTPPELEVGGTLAEQAKVGTRQATYSLNYTAKDGDEGTATAATPYGTQGIGPGQLERPQGVAVDSSGDVWVSDKINNKVVEYDSSGNLIRQIPSGTANGQINGPREIALGKNGNLWVAEAGNKRVQQFTPTGEFVSKIEDPGFVEPFGVAVSATGSVWITDNGAGKIFNYSEAGVLNFSQASTVLNSGVPYGIGVDAFGHAWVAFQGTDSVVETESTATGNGPRLKKLFQFGGTGTAAGQFRAPFDVEIAKSGNIFVSDALNNRVQEFKPDGSFMRQFGTEGVASNQLKEPRSLATGPGNTLIIADAANHRVARWTHADRHIESGVVKAEVKVDGAVQQIQNPGCAAGKNCSLSGSWTMNANAFPAGKHKVEVLTTDGVGLTTTKSLEAETHGDLVSPGVALSGSMTEQATVGTTRTTYKLKEVATDTGSAAEWKSGVVATTIKVDGNLVDSYNAACATEGCSVTREWTMQSSEYLGSHKVQVTATDGAGHVTTKELSITINKDVTPPKLTTGGQAFFTQPQNWLVQKTYAYTSEATDVNASGVASFQFKIDGVVVKQASGTCPGGSCAKTLTGEINVLNYSGGAHAAELVATDVAGNVAKKTWTINVDPNGNISAGEAEDTLEAVQATAGDQIIEGGGASGMPLESEWGSDPTLVQEGIKLHSEGAPVQTDLTAEAGDGFEVHSADGTIAVEPMTTSTNASATQVVAGGDSAVNSNTASQTDTVVRPTFGGLMTFQNIRDASGPETFSWVINMEPGQNLKLVNEGFAEVYYGEHPQFGIVAAAAHDAVGTPVPTTLSVSGNVLTFTVHHKAGNSQAGGAPFTYPVTQGVGWEGGFHTYRVAMPLPEIHNEEYWGGWSYVSPPEPTTSEDSEYATASKVYGAGPHKHFIWVYCSHPIGFTPEGYPNGLRDGDPGWENECGNPFTGKPGNEVRFFEAMHGKFVQQTGPKHTDFSTWHEGSQTDSIGCLVGGWGRAKEDEGKPSDDPTFRRGRAEKCLWWGETTDSRPKYATWGEHLTAVLRGVAEERSSCGDQCNGTPNPWVEHPMPPLAYYFWANGHYEKHETDCIDC